MGRSSDRFLVIGSNSFSGSTFVAHALAAGAQVAGISRSPQPCDAMLPYKWAPHDQFQFHQLDLNRDLDEIMAVADDFQPPYVVNFAAQSMVAESWAHPEHWMTTNVVSMVKLHDRLRTRPYLKKFVQISTPEVYGVTDRAVREDAPYNPSTPYAVSKAACDMSLTTFLRAYGFPVVFTRAANVCGPGQQLYRIIPRTIYCILAGEKLPLQGGGLSQRCFLHARDAAEAVLRAARQAPPGAIYHLAVDTLISIASLVRKICGHMGATLEDHVEIVEGRLGQDAAYRLDWSRAREELGWRPTLTLDEIIRETVGWMRDHWSELRDQPRRYVHKP